MTKMAQTLHQSGSRLVPGAILLINCKGKPAMAPAISSQGQGTISHSETFCRPGNVVALQRLRPTSSISSAHRMIQNVGVFPDT